MWYSQWLWLHILHARLRLQSSSSLGKPAWTNNFRVSSKDSFQELLEFLKKEWVPFCPRIVNTLAIFKRETHRGSLTANSYLFIPLLEIMSVANVESSQANLARLHISPIFWWQTFQKATSQYNSTCLLKNHYRLYFISCTNITIGASITGILWLWYPYQTSSRFSQVLRYVGNLCSEIQIEK